METRLNGPDRLTKVSVTETILTRQRRLYGNRLKAHHTLANFLSGECRFFSEPNLSGFKTRHTLADLLSPIFDESYLHAFKKLKRKWQHCHGFPPDKLSGTTTH